MQIVIPEKAYVKHYRKLLYSDFDIHLLYGGRDSGKSHFIAQKLIYDCLRLPYFRCMLIKKTYNSIKESQWQTIKDIVEAWGFESLFTFNVSPLTIECINGNRFLSRGCEDPQRIKSTKDPSHAWYEEGNQLTMEDFITVTTTLRTEKTQIQQWFSFNPECDGDYEDFWIHKVFFKDCEGKETFEGEWRLKEDATYKYIVYHSQYKVNPHCSPQRSVFLEQLSDISPYYYQVYTLGKWGRKQNKSPFCYAFNRDKHIGDVVHNPMQETYISFDFNRDPICCSVFQYYDDTIFGVETIKLSSSNIYELCEELKLRYPNTTFIITGDASGRSASALAKDDLNYYQVIKRELELAQLQIKVPSINPQLKQNQVLVNAILARHKVVLDRYKCKSLIYDMENVRVLPDGTIEKRDRNDPAQQSDALDTFRYYLNTFHSIFLRL